VSWADNSIRDNVRYRWRQLRYCAISDVVLNNLIHFWVYLMNFTV